MAKKDEEVIAVGPGAEGEDVREEDDERQEEGQEERSEEGREEGDERVGHEESEQDDDDGRESIRRRRRAEKQRKRENRDRERLELSFLRQRNEQLERRQSDLDARVANGEMVSIDNKIAELDGQIREADRLKALAIDKSDGTSAAEADRIGQDLRAGRNQLVSVRDQRNRERQASPARQVDPAITTAAREWAESHEWYDPNLRDPDSRVAKALEDQLFSEGRLDARTPEYWREFDRRLKKYMPHRYANGQRNVRDEDDEQDDEDQGEREERRQERRPRGPRITTGGRERPLRKNEVYISAERKQAMIDANVWDDPVLREKYLKQYQKYDRDNRRH